jgi:Photosynthesis system II assembly factor YCF48
LNNDVQKLPQFAVSRLRETAPDNNWHPDADILTAFAEQSLPVRERTEIMEHLARCGDCREVLAMALPASEIFIPARIPARTSWLAWPVLRWGALAAALLAVTSIGVVQYLHQHQSLLASNSETPSVLENMDARPREDKAANTPAEPSGNPGQSFNSAANPDVAHPDEAQKLAPFSEPPAGFRIARHGARNAESETESTNQRRSMQAEDLSYGAKSTPEELELSFLQPGMILQSSLATLTQWVVTPAGTLRRSFDGGKNWESVRPEANLIFRAVAANGLDVWAGGSEGALFHTIDGGNRWVRQTPSYAGVALTGDILSIQFTDPQNGAMVTSTTQLWTTSDAGLSWQKQ